MRNADQILSIIHERGQRAAHTDRKTLESHVLRKRACVVRRGAGGKGLPMQYLACGLPDTLLGLIGTKMEAEEIKELLRTYLHETLKLELSEEKTLITHAATQAARFLGYEIVGGYCNTRLFGEKNKPTRVKRRRLNGTMRLRVPADVI